MGSDDIAGMDVRDRADDLAVFCQQRIAHPIDSFGIAGSETLLQQIDTMAADENLPLGGSCEPQEEIFYARRLFVQTMDEPFGYGSRCLERFVGDEIENRDVARMADAGENRQFVLRTNGA